MARKLLYDWLKAYRAHGAAGLNRKRGREVGGRPPPVAPPEPGSAAGSSAAGGAHMKEAELFRKLSNLPLVEVDAEPPRDDG